MSEIYTVVQGDYMSKIARKFGFVDYKTIWKHAKNAALKQKRPSPAVLFPGDKVFIPDKAGKEEDRGTDQSHKFLVNSNKIRLKIVILDYDQDPISGALGKLQIGGGLKDLPTDGDGLIDEQVDVGKTHVGLFALTKTDHRFDGRVGIRIGHLNPADTPSGQIARLNNLGYFAGTVDTGEKMDRQETIEPKDLARFTSAVEEFQCDHMGPPQVDGDCGKHTQAKLIEVHGC